MSLHPQYPKVQKFLKEVQEELGKVSYVVITERPLNEFCDLCGGHDGEHGGTCQGFKTKEERDEYLVEEAKESLLTDLDRLSARIGLSATKAFVLDWVDKMNS